MALNHLMFEYEGVKVALAPEFERIDSASVLGMVPVRVQFDGQPTREGSLTYDAGKERFITAITDYHQPPIHFENHPDLAQLAQKVQDELSIHYSILMQRGRVSLK